MLAFHEIWAVAKERQHALLQQAEKERRSKRWFRRAVESVRKHGDATAAAAARPESAFIAMLMRGSR